MQRKFIYLINPVSGTAGKNIITETIRKKTAEKKIPFSILPTDAAGNYEELKKKIASENITDVIICGGDGTVNQVANALLGVNINIGIIPAGSGNGLAFAAKIPANPMKALQVIFDGRAAYIDSFYINNKFSCMLCGLGFDAQVAHAFAQEKKRGLATYIKQSALNFFNAGCYPFEITVDKQQFKTEAFFISIANSNQYGNNFTIAPMASLQDGLLDVVVVNKMSKLQLVWAILNQVRNGKVTSYQNVKEQSTGVQYFKTDKITIINPKLAPLHIDGDPAETAYTLNVEVIPEAFRLLMP